MLDLQHQGNDTHPSSYEDSPGLDRRKKMISSRNMTIRFDKVNSVISN